MGNETLQAEDGALDPNECLILPELNKVLKEHHDLSCDIKWFSLAHNFGKNLNFKYSLIKAIICFRFILWLNYIHDF